MTCQAALYGDLAFACRELEDRGGLVDKEDEDGSTALHYAANRGKLKMMEYLVSKGAAVNAKNKIGYTPLHDAAVGGHVEAVSYLLSHGGDPFAEDNLARTPLALATRTPAIELLQAATSQVVPASVPP